MIKPYLITLTKLVNEVTGKVIIEQTLQETTAVAFSEQLLAFEQGLQQALDELVSSKQREILVKRKMWQLQLRCALILDLLSEENNAATMPNKTTALAAMLMRLLAYQHLYFQNYFNLNYTAPKPYVDAYFAGFKPHYQVLAAGLKKKKIAPALLEIVMGVFSVQEKQSSYTYQQLLYLKQLQVSLITFCQKIADEAFEQTLLAYLIYLNFNHSPLIKYVILVIDQEHAAQLGVKAQFELWCAKEQYFSALATKNVAGYHDLQGSAKSQILNHITCGIVYHQRNTANAMAVPQQATHLAISPYRIKLNISADALAYLLRLLIETEVVDAEPRSQLILFVSKHFQTAGIGEELLSANSLTTKYKQVVQRTALQLRGILKRMTKVIDSNFDC